MLKSCFKTLLTYKQSSPINTREFLTLKFYSFQEVTSAAGQNPHHITVTPVPGFGEPNKKKKSKGLKKSEHKSRMSLMHFGKKADSSSDEEHDGDRVHAITFDERLSLSFREKSENLDLSDSAKQHTVHAFPTPNQSDWI